MPKDLLSSGRKDPWQLPAWLLAALVVIPTATLFASFFSPEREILEHLADNVLPGLLVNTFKLIFGVGIFTLVVGVSLGWLTGACSFPGRCFFSWALALPMAIPAYVMAFIFLGLMDFSGPLQGWIRTIDGFERFMVEVRTTPFVVTVLGLTLYPYVYLLSRTSFLGQGRAAMEAARMLGVGPLRAFFRVAFPISRPWIAAGIALVLMETLADFGAVSIFNFDTFTTAIYKSWYGFFSLQAAAQLSSLLVLFALVLIVTESRLKSKMRFYDSSRGGAVHSRLHLRGWKAAAATLYCTFIFSIAFVIPLFRLTGWAVETLAGGMGTNYLPHAGRTLFLGILSALLISLAALLLAFAKRRSTSRLNHLLCRIATVGYALPGTVLAVAIFLPVAWFDKAVQAVLLHLFGLEINQVFLGTLVVMFGAYLVRFLAVAFSSVDSGMQNIKPNLDEAAAILGVKGGKAIFRIYLPLLNKSCLTALVLVLVDVLKEMPITLMTRPFGWDTLAVKIYELTSEGEWERAALPGLYLVAAGILPVFLLIRKLEK